MLFAAPPALFATGEEGFLFYLDHYGPQEYQAHPSNWAIAQSPEGLIYVANANGILEFDGAQWRLIEPMYGTIARSLDVGADGRIYVGAQGDFGYLAPDSTNRLTYTSLTEFVDEEYHGFSDVWGTHAVGSLVYFQTPDRLFRWDGAEIHVWEAENIFHTSFVVENELYLRETRVGLLHLDGDVLSMSPGGSRFANRAVFSVEEHADGERLIGTRAGFFIQDDTGVRDFSTQLDPYLESNNLYHGTALTENTYAFSLLGAGVFVIDQNGQIVQRLNQNGQLPENEVNYLYADREGSLWMALHNEGIARAAMQAPLSRYSNETGLEGLVYHIYRYRSDIFVATSSGLFRMERAMDESGRGVSFERVLGPQNTYTITSLGGRFLVGTDDGIHAGEDGELVHRTMASVFSFAVDSEQKFAFAGTRSGLALIRSNRQGLEFESVDRLGEEIRSMTVVDDQTLWVGGRRGVTFRVTHRDGDVIDVERFGASHGMPQTSFSINQMAGDVFIASRRGGFRFSEEKQEFVPDTTIFATPADAEGILSVSRGKDGKFYLVFPDRVEILDLAETGEKRRTSPLALRFPREDIVQTFVEEDGTVWISDRDELVRYDPRRADPYAASTNTLVREVEDLGSGARLYGGAAGPLMKANQGFLKLPYERNALQFSFASPQFNHITPLEYQYRIAGVDEEWSEWSELQSATYTNLREGRYQFEVRARNERGVVSEAGVLSVRILPPWYRTWWAYAIYLLSFVMLAIGYGRYRRLLKAQQQSEEQARELARERLLNERLRQANESLEQANKLKETFLANTSHELRTPLTAILGFASVLREETNEKHGEFLDIIEENGERLLETLNALLDLASIKAGIKEAHVSRIDAAFETQRSVQLLVPLAQRQGLRLSYEGTHDPVYAVLDRGHLRRILHNVIGNAIKFTVEGGIDVSVRTDDGKAYIVVSDTGIGIEKEFVPHLFDEFTQESSGMSRTHEGNGLGLAITAQLVDSMNGSIEVDSVKDEGSTFTITFPLADPHPDVRELPAVHETAAIN